MRAGTAPLEVTCVLDGYAPATVAVAPETPPGTLGHRTIGGAAGMALDRVLLTDPLYPGSIVVDVAPRRPRPHPAPLAG